MSENEFPVLRNDQGDLIPFLAEPGLDGHVVARETHKPLPLKGDFGEQ